MKNTNDKKDTTIKVNTFPTFSFREVDLMENIDYKITFLSGNVLIGRFSVYSTYEGYEVEFYCQGLKINFEADKLYDIDSIIVIDNTTFEQQEQEGE